jgi:AraC family transcriptional regulator
MTPRAIKFEAEQNVVLVHDPLSEALRHPEAMGWINVCEEESRGTRRGRAENISKAEGLPKWRLKRVLAYVNENIGGRIRLADLAAAAGLSPMYFAAQFRAATAHRPHDYVVACRVERAQALMLSTDLALAEVSLMVGFRAQAHFTDVFRRVTRETPARWRQARKGDLDRFLAHATDEARKRTSQTPGLYCDRDNAIFAEAPKHGQAICNIRLLMSVINDELSSGQTWLLLPGPTIADIGPYFYIVRAI